MATESFLDSRTRIEFEPLQKDGDSTLDLAKKKWEKPLRKVFEAEQGAA